MSISLTRVIILCILCFCLGFWFRGNLTEGVGALATFKAYIGRSVRGEQCPKDMVCTRK